MKKLLLALSLSLVLFGCAPTEEAETSSVLQESTVAVSSEAAETVSVTISLTDGGTVVAGSEKTVEVEAGTSLFDVMKETIPSKKMADSSQPSTGWHKSKRLLKRKPNIGCLM